MRVVLLAAMLAAAVTCANAQEKEAPKPVESKPASAEVAKKFEQVDALISLLNDLDAERALVAKRINTIGGELNAMIAAEGQKLPGYAWDNASRSFKKAPEKPAEK